MPPWALFAPYNMSMCTVSANCDGSTSGVLFLFDMSTLEVEPRSVMGS